MSKARVDAPGPFSAFPGIDRVLVVTEGEGLVLDHGDAAPRAVLRQLKPYAFSGDWPTSAELPSGPVADFNLLVRRGAGRGNVRVLIPGARPEQVTLRRGDALVHVLKGGLAVQRAAEARVFALGTGESLLVRGAGEGEGVDLAGQAPDCVALLATIHLA